MSSGVGGERLGTFCRQTIGRVGNEFGDSQHLVGVSGVFGDSGGFRIVSGDSL